MGRLFAYHLALALRSLRRDPGLSTAIVAGLALATCTFGFMSIIHVRGHAPHPEYSRTLYQVELPHPGAYALPTTTTGFAAAMGAPLARRTRVSLPEAQALSATDIPRRQTATFRARLVAGPRGEAATLAYVRFVNADFFAMFGRTFRSGGPWTAADEASLRPVAVLGKAAAARWFPRASLTAPGTAPPEAAWSLTVEGRPFRVAGVLAEHQPFWVEWDLSAVGMDEDAIYLPMSAARGLLARPELPVFQAPVGPGYDDLMQSNAVFVSHWLDLPGAARVAAYRAFLQQRFGAPGVGHQLRSFAEWRAEFPLPTSSEVFFTLLTVLLLLGSGFNMARLLLAKGVARAHEIGIHRALGASRSAIFGRQMLEALLLAAPAALLGQLLVLPYVAIWDGVVLDTDIPLPLTAAGFLIGVVAGLLVGAVAGLYPAWQLSRIGAGARGELAGGRQG
jgi:putative ABC transport system permease protein